MKLSDLAVDNLVGTKQQGVYKIENIINNKVYVGSAANFWLRWQSHFWHLKHNRHHSAKLQNSWNKYGAENFRFSVIEYVDDIANLESRENFWIRSLDVLEKGYNIALIAYSTRGTKRTAEVRLKMSKAQEGNKKFLGKKHSEETKKLLSQTKMGNKNSAGRIVTEEQKQNISVKNTGRKNTPEQLANIKAGVALARQSRIDKGLDPHFSKGTPMSEKGKANVREAQIKSLENRKALGISHPNKGRKATPEAKANMAIAQQKRREKAKLALDADQ